jgi:hypothetical protein
VLTFRAEALAAARINHFEIAGYAISPPPNPTLSPTATTSRPSPNRCAEQDWDEPAVAPDRKAISWQEVSSEIEATAAVLSLTV